MHMPKVHFSRLEQSDVGGKPVSNIISTEAEHFPVEDVRIRESSLTGTLCTRLDGLRVVQTWVAVGLVVLGQPQQQTRYLLLNKF